MEVVGQDSSCGACGMHSALMATASLGRPSPCVVVVVVGRGGVVGGRVAATAARLPRRRSFCKLRCFVEESDVSPPSAVDVAPPTIDLEIIGPEVGREVTTTSVGSGDKLLRNLILDNKLELYGLYGKVMNCGAGGSCGTCIVEGIQGSNVNSLGFRADKLSTREESSYIMKQKCPPNRNANRKHVDLPTDLEGKELLNERTDAEYKFLKKKPESWRLSCQTIVGDKSNSGKVVVQRLPQKKK